MQMKRVLLLATILLGVCLAPAQKKLSFEVASIKPAQPQPDGRMGVSMGGDPGRLDYQNVTIRDIMVQAYNVKDFQITGPDWMSSLRFNLEAKLPPNTTREDVAEMLQTLLAERFKLEVHRESKEMQVYALVVAKGGSKLKTASGEGPGGRIQLMHGHLEVQGMDIGRFSAFLARFVGRPVLDMTELRGSYDIKLDWTPDEQTRANMLRSMGGAPGHAPPPPDGARDGESTGPSLFTALQEQLGLRMDSRKAPVEILIVDKVEKTPTEN